MGDRSARREVRNPILALPSAKRIMGIPEPHRAVLANLLRDLADDARFRANHSWRTHKAPMALYWKAVAVYAGHLGRVLGGARG